MSSQKLQMFLVANVKHRRDKIKIIGFSTFVSFGLLGANLASMGFLRLGIFFTVISAFAPAIMVVELLRFELTQEEYEAVKEYYLQKNNEEAI